MHGHSNIKFSVPCFVRVVSDVRPFSVGIRFEASHFVLHNTCCVGGPLLLTDIFLCKEIHISGTYSYI